MRSVLYLVRKPPGALANEMIDMMLVSGVFEQPARVLFLDDGVRQLASGQDASLVDRKDTAKALGALPVYDVEELFDLVTGMTKAFVMILSAPVRHRRRRRSQQTEPDKAV